MAASMALGVGSTGNLPIGMGSSSPIVGGGLGLNGALTPSHTAMKYCGSGGESGASSINSPISAHGSTPNSTITINNAATGSLGKSGMSSNGMDINSSANLILTSDNSNSHSESDFNSKCKRKINFSNLGMPQRAHQPATVARRNARERNRVKQVNNGFAALKQHIPLGHRSKKMSKVETLRCAVDYIRNLQGMLHNGLHTPLSVASPADSTASMTSGDILLDEENMEMDIQSPQQQQQMNGVSSQRDAYALSSSSSSSSPTSSDFAAVVAHLPHHLAALHSHHQSHQQQHLGSTNQLRHLSLSHHLHGTSRVPVPAALLMEANGNTVIPKSNQLSPTSSEEPASPSYATEVPYTASNLKGNGMYSYEKYEPVSPEDEELLDAIAWWQES